MSRRRPFASYVLSSLTVVDASTDGRGIARSPEGQVVFVHNAIPGDVVEADVYADRRSHLMARLKRLISPSPDRREPRCPHVGICGGCRWQHQSYAAQLRFKEKQVRDAFERIAGIPDPPIRPILAAPDEFHYRNKLEFTFAPSRWLHLRPGDAPEADLAAARAQPTLGYHVPQAFDKIFHVDTCLLMDERANAVRNRIYTLAVEHGLSFHNPKTHEGFLRSVVFRRAEASDQWMLILVVHEDEPECVDRLFNALRAEFPFIHAWVWIVNPNLNDAYAELPWQTWQGPDFLTETLLGQTYRISPVSFFQTNPAQAARLYEAAFEMARSVHPNSVPLMYDLYCGTGSIAIAGHSLADGIVGIEYNASAVDDAKVNAQLNGLSHLHFYAGNMADVLTDATLAQYGRPQLVLTDPPRGGMDAKVVNALLRLEAPTVVYISCNVATQARDIQLLRDKYTLQAVQPVDMFPQTSHIESVALLTLNS